MVYIKSQKKNGLEIIWRQTSGALLLDNFVTCLELLGVSRVALIREFVILKVVKLSAELFTRMPEFWSSKTEKFVNL